MMNDLFRIIILIEINLNSILIMNIVSYFLNTNEKKKTTRTLDTIF